MADDALLSGQPAAAPVPDEGQTGFDLGAPTAAAATPPAYRVLARKYRPSTFADLIGQDAMVRTLFNAFAAERIPQAWILTGVRGVGKTTTARILARALNYTLPGRIEVPTIEMKEPGIHCQAIIESRHIDVIEMDAASNTSVNDIREIIESVRYRPVSARVKVYIIDEVHMLSTAAFNGLLKTLEEPPEHVKFIFATTEIRKVPVTVLSRCQRFDLRRVEAGTLVGHLTRICAAETVEVESEALALIARASEGSVRDALSLLDQAIAHGAGAVRADDVRGMLGLADRARVVDLFERLMEGRIGEALDDLRDQYDAGADPVVLLADLAEFTHLVTRVKIVPAVADDPSLTETERKRARALATGLSMRVLSRTWQMLLKGMQEVQATQKPILAAEMLLVRLAYAADLPTPDEALRQLATDPPSSGGGGGGGVTRSPPGDGPRAVLASVPGRGPMAAASPPRPAAPAQPVLAVRRFEDLVQLALARQDLIVKTALERDVRLVRFEDGVLEFALQPGASRGLVGDIKTKLDAWTGRKWMVALANQPGAPTLAEQVKAQRQEQEQGVRADPRVRALLYAFPGAEIVNVRIRAGDDAGTDSEADTPPEDRFAPPPDDDIDL
jgi:DNA polymerase-3 subunit gamma/tau